ncbi:MAG: bifunctional nicotinamidase/pyrazinamidase [Verrucomicrobia bacterium]|nr:MAG: bifunctional nicotinamidase/pyrazinamidase [Verrucomicrobiota bacterium]
MKALIIVDVQNDFLSGGALPVPRGDEIIPVVNDLQQQFELIVATQDWHPRDHGSFAANHAGKKPGDRIMLDGIEQILWPIHCVQNTPGAAFAPGLETNRFARVFQKGVDSKIDSYSAFFDNAHRRATGLGDYLKQRGVTDVYLCGLATDYCVKYSVLDACQLGFKALLIVDVCRGINLAPGNVDLAIEEMKASGASVLQSSDLRDKRE